MYDQRVTDWSPRSEFCGDFVSYRIWMKQTDQGFYQRHEWMHRDGWTDLQDWVPTKASFLKDMSAPEKHEAA